MSLRQQSPVDPINVRSSFCPESLLLPQTRSCPSSFAASNFPASHASPCLSTSYKARPSRPLECTSLSHVLPMARYMWLPLGFAAHPNLAYSYPTIRHAMCSTQKPCRTEERFIMVFNFYISLAMEGHLIYINCPMYPPGKAGYLRYLSLLNHPNKLFIQNLVVY